MIGTYQCWNCCGLRRETDGFDCTCPNCESLMERPGMDVAIAIEQFNPRLKVIQNGAGAFKSIGSLLSNERELLSYAIDKYFARRALNKYSVAALFVRPSDAPQSESMTLILSDDPMADFFAFHNWLIQETDFYGYSTPSEIDQSAEVHPSAHIASEDVIVESGVKIGANVTILPNTRIGANTVVSPGTVIGMPGARLIHRTDGSRFRALHAGGVRIGHDVFIGANTVIMKSVWSQPTTIEDGAYIGNLCNLGHNTTVCHDATVLPCAILCGRCRVETGATVSPGAIVSNGAVVGSGAEVTLGAVVTRDVEPGQKVSGNFAVPHGRLIEHVKTLAWGEALCTPWRESGRECSKCKGQLDDVNEENREGYCQRCDRVTFW